MARVRGARTKFTRSRSTYLILALIAAGLPLALPASAAPAPLRGSTVQPVEHSSFVFRDLAARSAPAHLLPPNAKEEEIDEGPLPANLPVPGDVEIQEPRDGSAASEPGPSDPPDPAAPPALAASFKAIDDDISSIPPDTNGAVGPSHVLTTLNNLVRIQTRTGGTISTVALTAFWSDTGTFDPRVQYDPYNGRFVSVATVDSGSTSAGVFVAASATSDPTGTWYRYRYQADPSGVNWCDFPNLAFSNKWLTVTCNMFSNGANVFSNAKVFAVDRAAVYANAAAPTATAINLPAGNGASLAPAITYDAALGTMHLIQSWNGNSGGNGYVRLYSITGAVGSPSLNVGSLIGVAAPWHYGGGLGDFAPQSGDARKINLIDDRMLAVYRNGALWASHTVFLPATSPTRAAIQWWKIDPGTSTLSQRGRLEDTTTGMSFGFPSIAVNANDDMMVGYSSFSSTQYASAGYAVRYAGDAANTLQGNTLLKGGEAPYYKTYGGGRNRWGDYSSTTVDPLNDFDFWTVQEFAWTSTASICDPPEPNCDRWSTWWGKVTPNSATPIITPSPSNVAFGSQRQFVSSSPQTVTVTNTGASSATLGTLTVTGANGGEFPLTTTPPNTCNGATLAPSASCTFGVRFTPTTTGPRSASVQIPSNAPGSPVLVPMTGTGVAPIITTAPTPVAFGSQQVGTTSSPQTLTVTNSGTATATFSSATITGSHANNFGKGTDTCTGQTINGGGGSCTIALMFAPSATGARTATLTLSHDGPSGQNNASLTGTGTASNVALNPSSLAFGTVVTGTTTPTQLVTVTNSGTGTLSISAVALTGADPSQYQLSSDLCSSAALAPGGSCTFRIAFAPTTDGAKSASASITSNAPGSPSLLPLSGTGAPAAPAVGLSPASVSFGSRELTTTSPPTTVTITNTGTAPLTLGALTLTGAQAPDFGLTEACSSAVLGPDATCQANVTFSPSAFGLRSAALNVPSDASGSPHSVPLSGTGVGSGAISLNPSSLSFGGQPIGTTSGQRSVTLTNTGSGPLTIHTVTLGGANPSNYALVVDPCTGATLAASQSCQLMLTFTPTAAGARLATLSFASSAATNPTLSITGTGTQPKLGVSATSIAFGLNAVGQASPVRDLTVTNIGSGPLGPISPSFAGAHAGDFALTANGCTASYAAGQSCTMKLRATPSGDGTRTGTLVLSSNDPLGPTHVALSIVGDGVAPTSTISNADMSFVIGNLQSFSGNASDTRAGVAETVLTMRNVAGAATTVKPQLECDTARTTCTWRVVAPLVPGIYTVNARSTDLVGNAEDPGPTVTIVVV